MKVLQGIYIEEAPLCFLDCETTGLDPFHGDRICEVAFVRIEKGEIVKSFETLINPDREISLGAYSVNGIHSSMLEDKPRFLEIVPEILEGIVSAVIVGHNVAFDLSFLTEEFRRVGMNFPTPKALDTGRLARRKFTGSFSLAEVAGSLGIPVSQLGEGRGEGNHHRAMSDVLLLKDVFERLVTELRQREGLIRLNDLLKIAAL